MYRLPVLSRRVLQHRRIALLASAAFASANTVDKSSAEPKKVPPPSQEKKEDQAFDLTKEWERAKNEGPEFLKNLIFTEKEQDESSRDKEPPTQSQHDASSAGRGWTKSIFGSSNEERTDNENDKKDSDSFFDAIKDFTSMVTGSQEKKEDALRNLIHEAQQAVDSGDLSDEQGSFTDILNVMQNDLEAVEKSMESTIGQIDLSRLFATSVFYYLEAEDERKNPSWKRRVHRFHSGIDTRHVNNLNDALYLAELSYADTVEDIKSGLKAAKEPLELVFCDIDAKPGEPGHFIALKKDQSPWSSTLDVVICIRGTKTITDAITDCIHEAVDYRGGKSHSGIMASGKWLVDKHLPLLESLRTMAKKRKLNVRLIGHSLGAGAATIAGMELNDQPNIDAKVVGFGCPSLLSEELSVQTIPFVTTVVCDSDVIPRMSGATIANVLLNIMEHNWIPSAKRDVDHAFQELLRVSSNNPLTKATVDAMSDVMDSMFTKFAEPTISPATTERISPVLYPPGEVVHIYRDGSGISGSIAPCTFFGEIDVTRRMVSDHSIKSGYSQIFLELMRQYHQDQNFSFETKESA